MLPQPQTLARQAEVGVPLHPAVAPILIPLWRAIGMAEKLDLHLLEFARAEREIPRRDLVTKALAHLGDAERHANAGAIADVAKIDEDALRSLGPQERSVLLG